MDNTLIISGLALIFGLYMAWSIGANDAANALGTSVGSKALSMKQAIIIGSILEFSGALFFGSNVSETVQKGIVNPEIFSHTPMTFVFGMSASLLTAGAWLQIASYYGWPVSTTHSIVGSVLGFGLVAGGQRAIEWQQVLLIGGSWIFSPIMSACLSFIIFTLIRRYIFFQSNPIVQAKKLTPFLVFFVTAILSLVLLFKGLKNMKLVLTFSEALVMSIGVGLVAFGISYYFVRKIPLDASQETYKNIKSNLAIYSMARVIKHLRRVKSASVGKFQDDVSKMLSESKILAKKIEEEGMEVEKKCVIHLSVERIFAYLQVLSVCLMAFAHGANDVANAIGPLSAIIEIVRSGHVYFKAEIPTWILAMGGLGIVLGLSTWGWKVIETIGKKITELTPTRGFSAEFGAATTILIASRMGLPISSTHTLVGAVLGVGFARGISAINLNVVRNIVISWIVTIPVGAIMAITFFYILRGIFA